MKILNMDWLYNNGSINGLYIGKFTIESQFHPDGLEIVASFESNEDDYRVVEDKCVAAPVSKSIGVKWKGKGLSDALDAFFKSKFFGDYTIWELCTDYYQS